MDPELEYQKTLEYLYSFVDYSLTRQLSDLPLIFDLDRMRKFLDYLGHPEMSYPIIHVAGTKGKGSVCALCASVLQAAGYRVGLYTSPHLQDYAERIQINGKSISHLELVELVKEIRPYLDKGTQLTTFEITTALAFLFFARHQASAVVAEVGLGGRLDATNVVFPIVSVITSISYDHVQVLGHTLGEIANEKGGIIKPGIPVVISPQNEEARMVFEQLSSQRKSPLIQVGKDYLFSLTKRSLKGQSFEVWRASQNQSEKRVKLRIPLLGLHQVENAATAFAALQVARTRGLYLTIKDIRKGYLNVSWPGRFEVLRTNPPIIVDSAHNFDSAKRLSQALNEYFPEYPVILIFGASEDKNIQGILSELTERARLVIFTRSYHPRAQDPSQLMKMVEGLNKPAMVVPAVEDALEEAIKQAGSEALILVAGSIFVAAGARQTWLNQNKLPEAEKAPGN